MPLAKKGKSLFFRKLKVRTVSVPAMSAFRAILPSHGRKRKGSYSQPSSSQCPNSYLVTSAARFAGRLNIPCGQRPQVVRDGLCAYTTHICGSHFIRLRTLLSIKPFIDRVREAKVHSIFFSDQIVFPSASIVIMASHARNIFDVIYVDGPE